MAAAPEQLPPRCRRVSLRRSLRALVALLLLYGASAYLLAPAGWRLRTHRRPSLEDAPRISRTKDGIPGDPLNVALVGSREQLVEALLAAGWKPADPITLTTSLRIARSSVFHTSYEQAPVSNLYVWGRKQDLAFQLPVGHDPRRRHHVRFWASPAGEAGQPLWLGGATYDRRVGLSHTTGQVTHHIDPDVDHERDKLIADLQQAGWLARLSWVEGFHHRLTGRNGGGDRYHTDGRLAVGELSAPGERPDGGS